MLFAKKEKEILWQGFYKIFHRKGPANENEELLLYVNYSPMHIYSTTSKLHAYTHMHTQTHSRICTQMQICTYTPVRQLQRPPQWSLHKSSQSCAPSIDPTVQDTIKSSRTEPTSHFCADRARNQTRTHSHTHRDTNIRTHLSKFSCTASIDKMCND